MQITSLAAKMSQTAKRKCEVRDLILNHLKNIESLTFFSGCTDEQLQNALGLDGSTERPRRGELVTQGLVEDSGLRRKSASGRDCIVWRVKR